MKSATVTFGLFTGLASAFHHHHPQLHHFNRRDNSTLPGGQTTITVDITSTRTVTSCAPTVTDCPLKGGNGTVVVTEVVDLTTTVCPQTEVASISSSVLGEHSSGNLPGSTHTVSPGGGYPTAGYPVAGGYPTVVPTTGVRDQTVVMTMGPDSAKSLRTTVIQSTYTAMVTVTGPAPAYPSGDAPSEVKNAAGEPTTTLTMTTTGTRTVTVDEPEQTGANSPIGGGNGPVAENAEGSGPADCVASTVTVTAPASTVYVTVAPGPSDASEYDDEDEDDYCPPEDEEDDDEPAPVTSEVTQIVTPIPYPTNGTYPTGGSPKPTHAINFRRHMY